jgi:hypothetical protein
VHESLSHNRTTGYTATLKLMQIMAEKGLVTRDESRRTHICKAAGNPDHTRQQPVSSLLDWAFGGIGQGPDHAGALSHGLHGDSFAGDHAPGSRARLDDCNQARASTGAGDSLGTHSAANSQHFLHRG